MARTAQRVGLLLTLGFVTTTGVAWGLSFCDIDDAGMRTEVWVTHKDGTSSLCVVRLYRDVGSLLVTGNCAGSEYLDAPGIRLEFSESTARPLVELAPRWAIEGAVPWIDGRASLPRSSEFEVRRVLARGFPLLSHYGVVEMGMNTGNVLKGGWRVPGREAWLTQAFFMTPLDVVIPFRLIWRGVFVNTMCYAAAWWGLFVLVRLPRRVQRWRRGKGACRWCGYDLGGIAGSVCPECGRVPTPREAIGQA